MPNQEKNNPSPAIVITAGEQRYQLDTDAITEFLKGINKTFNLTELPLLIEQICDSIDQASGEQLPGEVLRQLRFMRKLNTLMQFMVEEVS